MRQTAAGILIVTFLMTVFFPIIDPLPTFWVNEAYALSKHKKKSKSHQSSKKPKHEKPERRETVTSARPEPPTTTAPTRLEPSTKSAKPLHASQRDYFKTLSGNSMTVHETHHR